MPKKKRPVYYDNSCKCPFYFYDFNLLKTERICVIQVLSPYRAVNTLNLGYKKPIF